MGQSYSYATDSNSQEQVIVSPAQQAVNTALSTATAEVQQAIDSTTTAATEIVQAQTEYSQAQSVTTEY
jgi:hypothetical protein